MRLVLPLLLFALFAVLTAQAGAQPLGVQQQVSFTAPLDDVGTDSTDSAIAHGQGRSLVVWAGQEVDEAQPKRGRGSDRTVIMGRFVDGTATPVTGAFKISDSVLENVRDELPDVAYDPTRNRYAVVWDSNDADFDNETRTDSSDVIRGAFVSATGQVSPSENLTPQGENFRDPAIAYGAGDQFLVTYHGGYDHVVYVQRVNAADLTLNGDPTDITTEFGFGSIFLYGITPEPDVAFDAASGRWLVVFVGQPLLSLRGKGELLDFSPEVYSRSFDGAGSGTGLVRVSHEVGDPFTPFSQFSREPAVSPDTTGGGFLVVYTGFPESEEESPVRGEFTGEEIFSRRMNGDGSHAADPIQVSDPPADDAPQRSSRRPDVWHDPNADQFLVSWAQDITPEEDNIERVDPRIEYEVFAKKVNNAGAPLEADTRLSNHNPNGEDPEEFDGDLPAITYDRSTCDYVVSWTGEELGESGNEKEEIWDRAYDAPACPAAQVAQSRAPVRCASVRNFPIRLVARRDREYEFVLVRVNGQPVQVTYTDRVRAQVNLSGLPLGRFSVDIEARLADGRNLKGVRRYFTCTKRLPPSNGLERKDAL